MFNHQKSVGCIFSCSLSLLVLCLSASLLRLALLSGHLFFGAGNSENCLNQFLGLNCQNSKSVFQIYESFQFSGFWLLFVSQCWVNLGFGKT
ncbi:TPA: hypothetical protein ACMDON_003564 [Vibrio cholerae]